MNRSVLSLSLDTQLLQKNPQTDVLERHKIYAKQFEKFVVLSLSRRQNANQNIQKPIKYDNLHLYSLSLSNRLKLLQQAYSFSQHLINRYSIDVITAQGPQATGVLATLICATQQLPFCLQLHNNYHYLPGWKDESKMHSLWIPVIDRVIQRADSLRVVDSTVVKAIRQRFPHLKAPIKVIPIPTDYHFFHQSIQKKNRYLNFIHVGRLYDEKNQQLLISAFGQLTNKHPRASLKLIGDGPLKQKLKTQINNQGLTKQIQLLGSLNRQQIKPHLHQADIFVLSSLYEGFSIAIQEAMAAGLPVITTANRPNWKNPPSQAINITIPANNQSALVNTMDKLVSQPILAHTIARNGQRYVKEKLDQTILTKQWVTFLQKTNKLT